MSRSPWSPSITHRLPALVLAALVGCGDAPPPVIAVAFQGTGADAVAVARDELAAWPIPIRVFFDSTLTGDPADVEVARAQRLAEVPAVVGVVGHGSSRGSLAAAPVYNEAGIPQIVPTGTSRLLADAGRWTLPLAPNDSVEGAFIADFVWRRLGARSVTVYYVNDEYGAGLRDGVRAGLASHGVVVVDEVSVDTQTDFALVVEASLRRGVPDVVVSGARWVETGAITRLLRERHPGIRVVAGDGALLMPQLAHEVGDAAPALFVVSFWLPDPADSLQREFVERLRRVVGHLPIGTHAMTHDAIMLLATAVREVGRDPERIREFLLSLGAGRAPYRGVTGPIAFGPDRRANFAMTRLVNGWPERVDPP